MARPRDHNASGRSGPTPDRASLAGAVRERLLAGDAAGALEIVDAELEGRPVRMPPRSRSLRALGPAPVREVRSIKR